MFKKTILAASLSATLVGLSGCASVDANKQFSEQYETGKSETQRMLDIQEAERQRAIEASVTPKVKDYSYVNTTPVTRDSALSLSSAFHDRVSIDQPFPASIDVIMEKLSHIARMNVNYESDLVDTGKASGEVGGGRDDSASQSLGDRQSQMIDLTALSGPQGMSGGQGDTVGDKEYTLSASGTLKDVLDAAANKMNVSWRFDREANEVVFFKYMTRQFDLSMLPGNTDNEVGIDTSSGDQESAEGATSRLSFENETNVWESLSDTVNTMLSSRGAFTVAESTGTLTIRDYPDVVERVAKYINDVNDAFSRQVSVQVRVLKVKRNSGETRGINWKGLFESSRFNASLESTALRPGNATSGLAGLILGVPEGANAWGGSQALIDSLSSIGEVSEVTSTNIQTVNNQPAPVSVRQKVNYLRSITQTVTQENVSTSLTPGEVSTGFSMQLLPKVKPNGRDLLMQVMLSLSTLDSIEEFSSEDSTIQLPQVSTRDFVQRAWLRSGQSLVLAGFESTQNSRDRGGMFDAEAWMAGGNKNLENTKESIVIVITPVVSSMKNGLN